MSTALDSRPSPAAGGPDPRGAVVGHGLGWGTALRTVVGMELRQRLRSRGWYVLLGVFFVLVGIVTLGALGLHTMTLGELSGMSEDQREAALQGAGQWLFDGVLLFTLTLALLVSPALAANAISGDRAGGTLAITQVTLLRTGQLLMGKWLAAWAASTAFLVAALPWLVVAAFVGRVSPGYVVAGLLLILAEFAVVTGIGVGVSAITGRTLFAVVVTYLLVALLSIGTVIALVLSMQVMTTTVRANSPQFEGSGPSMEEMQDMTQAEIDAYYEEQARLHPNGYDSVADACAGPMVDQEVTDGRRVVWLVAANPYLVLADAMPWEEVPTTEPSSPQAGPLNMLSAAYRLGQRDPVELTECVDGKLKGLDDSQIPDRAGTWPMWPLGLAMQGVLTAGLLWWGHRRLDTPAGKLAAGTRVA